MSCTSFPQLVSRCDRSPPREGYEACALPSAVAATPFITRLRPDARGSRYIEPVGCANSARLRKVPNLQRHRMCAPHAHLRSGGRDATGARRVERLRVERLRFADLFVAVGDAGERPALRHLDQAPAQLREIATPEGEGLGGDLDALNLARLAVGEEPGRVCEPYVPLDRPPVPGQCWKKRQDGLFSPL